MNLRYPAFGLIVSISLLETLHRTVVYMDYTLQRIQQPKLFETHQKSPQQQTIHRSAAAIVGSYSYFVGVPLNWEPFT